MKPNSLLAFEAYEKYCKLKESIFEVNTFLDFNRTGQEDVEALLKKYQDEMVLLIKELKAYGVSAEELLLLSMDIDVWEGE